MTVYLKQSTASQRVYIGPLMVKADGSLATSLSIANTDIRVIKAGASATADKNSGGATHMAGGVYYADLDATDTNTLGDFELVVGAESLTTIVPLRLSFTVLPANVYDSMFGSDLLDVNTTQVGGTVQTAADLGALITRALGLVHENFRISSPAYDANNRMTGCTMKIYPTATDANNDTNAIATYTVAATYDGSNRLATYKVTKA